MTMQYVCTVLAILMAVAVRQYYTMRTTRWGMSMALIIATKHHHRASTCSDIVKRIISIDLYDLLKSGLPTGNNGGQNGVHCERQWPIRYT